MELITLLTKAIIEKYSMTEYEALLCCFSDKVISYRPPAGIITDSCTVKCIKQYYLKDGQQAKISKVANPCFYIQKYYGIEGNNSCISCHSQCLQKLKQKDLDLIKRS